MATRVEDSRERLLLALSVLSGRRRRLTSEELKRLGIHNNDDQIMMSVVVHRCEVLIAEAIIAGGYR